MKKILFFLMFFSLKIYSNDFEPEILSAGNGDDTTIFDFSDNITYRHFHSFQNWKDSLGDWVL